MTTPETMPVPGPGKPLAGFTVPRVLGYRPLMIDLCCGLGGWAEGGLAEGWDVVGFDVERHVYGGHKYPAQLVLQDILSLDGRQFRGKVSLITASPPCQRYSYMSMPWTRAKTLAKWYRDPDHPERIEELNALFNACVRIGKEAGCPIIIENVRGAQPWVGRARWNFGSYYLFADVPALMPTEQKFKSSGMNWSDRSKKGQDFTRIAGRQAMEGTKNGNDWFGSGEDCSLQRRHGSKSSGRKAASAMIARIPYPLARHIAATFRP
jgi:hypothetical protein